MKPYLWLLPLLPSFTTARTASFHPAHNPSITFSITVPHNNPSSIFFRIQAPTSLEWIALAQGTQMSDANMFLVYASSSNPKNVTVSPRTAPGHRPPSWNPDARVSVLEGSGIDTHIGEETEEGLITADIECFTCLRNHGGEMDPQGTETRWVWAYRESQPREEDGRGSGGFQSDDLTARIAFHSAFGKVLVDLSRAKTDPASHDLFSNPDFGAVRPVAGSDDNDRGDGTGYNTAIAHGLLMTVSFAVLFPLFALTVPLGYPVVKVHAPLQAFAVSLTLLGAVLGVNLWTSMGNPAHTHPILGLALVSTLFLIQPALGQLQHHHFVRVGGKSSFGFVHRWVGRVGILLGVVNGVLGFLWVGAGDRGAGGWYAAFVWYVSGAVVLGVVYVGVRVWLHVVEKRKGVEGDIRDSVDGGYRDLEEEQEEEGEGGDEGGNGDANR
ncbi:hypothetical protein BJY04DRAFT_213538 [Aspergillus karnatakaensis]|uniref:cytochrome and DOMON domain-containing protein n=1 Tax=Aspergillus karnatakaensis TaxID=1810916 RepID=UPI003CCDB440